MKKRKIKRYYTDTFRSRIIKACILLFIVAAGGTFGYHLLEGWTLLDSFYMTIITFATVGYGETHPLSDGGRLFTILLIISSLGMGGYAFSTLASFVIEGEFNKILRGRKMDKHISKLKDHFILCGCGPTGAYIAREFYKTRTPFLVIDKDPNVIKEVLQIGDIPYIQGDATQDETLELAGIERAEGLVTTLGEDKDNVFVVLSARALNPELRIISRLISESNEEKLKKAGANEVVSPNAIGGMRMASVMLRPSVVNFLDAMLRVPDQVIRMEEVTVEEGSPLLGKTLGEANIGHKTGLLVIAIKPSDGGYRFNPGAQTKLDKGDVLIVMGNREMIQNLVS